MGIFSGGNYQNPGNRQAGFSVNVSIDMGNLPTLPERMTGHLIVALEFHLKDAAEVVIHRAQSKLEPLGHAPGAIVGPHVDQPGGLLTGRLRGTLVAQLAHNMAVGIVAYNLLSDEAEYWEYIEFGHWVKNATPAWFWPGYHMLESSIAESIPAIRRSVKAAWEDTAIALAAEARTPTPGIHVGGTSPLLHR